MKKKSFILPLLSGLLIAPTLLAYQVKADQELEVQASEQVTQQRTEEQDNQGSETSNSQTVLAVADSEQAVVADNPVVESPVTPTASSALQTETNPASPPVLEAVELAPTQAATSSALATQSKQEAVQTLLQDAVADQRILGSSTDDLINLAKSLGMLSPDETDFSQAVSPQELTKMTEIAEKVKVASQASQKAPLFLNGKAQPIFPYTNGAVESGYSNEQSDIIRYTVYVETDYDTDNDGKRDLVKALVQVPRAAANGDYKAATIFEARPYVAGITGTRTLEQLGLQSGGSYDMTKLYQQPKQRQPVKTASTQEAATAAQSSDWYYYNPYERNYDYEDLKWYDYFLVRGFAVVTSAGLGTHGSEGISTIGSDLEIAAFKNIIEWLNGKRTAYTDRSSNIAIKADWANGNVGMTGLSWAGTTTFGVATTGVEGLKTIVPAAGIASWYDYFNSQGSPFQGEPSSNLSWLSTFVASRILNQEDWDQFKDTYANYISQLDKDQNAHDYNYSDIWKNRDYTIDAAKIKTPTMIVHGLNDTNVKTKHFELMYEALKKAGQDVKLYLHQGDHTYPVTVNYAYGFNTGQNETFYELLNRWFSHYLYDVPNDVEQLPAVFVQDNDNPNHWTTYEQWETPNRTTLTVTGGHEEVSVNSDYAAKGINWQNRNEMVVKGSSTVNVNYVTEELAEDMTIKGRIPLHFSAALAKGQGKNLQVTAMLVDLADQEFDAVSEVLYDDGNGYSYNYIPLPIVKEGGFWQGSNLANLDLRQIDTIKTNYKVIASGWVNLRNPESGWTSASSSTSLDPQIGAYHDYTAYLQPTVYKVKKGHRLGLILATYDATFNEMDGDPYEVRFKRDSIRADLPMLEQLVLSPASYVPILVENGGAGQVASPHVEAKKVEQTTWDQTAIFAQEKVQILQTKSASDPNRAEKVTNYAAPAVLPQTGSRSSIWSLLGLVTLTISFGTAIKAKREPENL